MAGENVGFGSAFRRLLIQVGRVILSIYLIFGGILVGSRRGHNHLLVHDLLRVLGQKELAFGARLNQLDLLVVGERPVSFLFVLGYRLEAVFCVREVLRVLEAMRDATF